MKRFVHRLDVWLTEEQIQALRKTAEELDRPLSQVGRRFIVRGMQQHQERRKVTAR